jgi:Rrf2 family cysteine metabolism transcriptional repressor
MNVSQKGQYALRAIFELARNHGQGGPVSVSHIAEVQAIPNRFLEQILGQLRQAGFVESRRGTQGGYRLTVPPKELSVGKILRFIDGPLDPVKCIGADPAAKECPLYGRCAFANLWIRARDAVADVYDNTSLQDLVDQDQAALLTADFCI